MRSLQWLYTLPPFILAGSLFVGLAWISFILALFGLFQTWLIGLFLIIFFVGIALSLTLLIRTKEWHRLALLFVLTVLSGFIGYTAEPTVFSGRDQGSIAEAAWRLAENGSLAFTTPVSKVFFELYGPGTALNFPGFAYTEGGSLITQFPIVYTAWLGSFLSLFGYSGYILGNLFLLVLFGWGMFELLGLFISRSFALGGTVLAIGSFLPIWMVKYTLTENLAAVLFILLSFSFVHFLKEKTVFWYVGTFLIALLFAFTRIEGFALLLIVLGTLLFSRPLRTLIFAQPWKLIFLPGLFMLFIFLRDFFINLPFYKMIGKAVVKKWTVLSTYGGLPLDGGSVSLGSIFLSYGLMVLFVVAFFTFLWLLRERKFSVFPILLLAAPTLIYFLLPSITLDPPWMLRRYYFSLYPTAIILVTIGIATLSERTHQFQFWRALVFLSFAGLFLFQGNGFVRALTSIENRSLLAQTASFAERFGEQDLVLIDRGASGDPFSMLAGPMNFLLEKQAVYLFNPDDLNRLDLTPFEKVYLLLPEDTLNSFFEKFGEKLLPIETVSFITDRLEATTDHVFSPPPPVTVIADSVLFQFIP